MTKMKLELAKNGIILSTPNGKLVYEQHEDDERANIESFAHFLWLLVHEYGPSTNRYSEARIQIDIVKGDKFEDTERKE